MVDLLWLARDECCVAPKAHLRCEAELAVLLAESVGRGALSEARALRDELEPRRCDLPGDTPVILTDLASFDALLEGCA